jgi:ankyrin repeat protein
MDQAARSGQNEAGGIGKRGEPEEDGEKMSTLHALALLAVVALQDPLGFSDGFPDDIHMQVQSGNLERVKALLAKNPKLLNEKGGYHQTPLQMAANHGYVEIAGMLIAAGAELDIETAAELGKTKEVAAMLKEKPWLAKAPHKPLHPAAGRGYLEIVKLLLDNGANPNLDYGFSNVLGPYTPLSNAVTGGHYEIAKLLCEHGAKPDVSAGRNHDSLFHFAVGFRDVRYVELMLKSKADPDAMDSHGLTPLHVAADIGDIAKVKVLLEFKADIDAKTKDGATPLFIAAANNRRDCCDYLLARGAKLDVYSACALGKTEQVTALLKADPKLANTRDDRLQRTPLFWAARAGDSKLVALLLAQGADVNLRAPRFLVSGNVTSMTGPIITGPHIFNSGREKDAGETPLHVAAEFGRLDVVRLLLAKGADVNAKGANSQTPLYLACEKHHHDVVKLLLGKGADAQARNEWGATPLHPSISDKTCVELLLAAKADPNVADQQGQTPLFEAAYHGHAESAQLLLAQEAKLDLYSACLLGKVEDVKKFVAENPRSLDAPLPMKFSLNETPLMLAARSGHVPVVEFLVAKGAAFDPAKVTWPSPLVVAAMHGRTKVVEWFLAHGVDVDARPDNEKTALMEACDFGQFETVRLLLEKKADPKLKVKFWGSALHCIGQEAPAWGPRSDTKAKVNPDRIKRDVEIARLLIDAGADLKAKNSFGGTPLHEAANRGQAEIAELLIAKGADVNARDQFGRTPLRYAQPRDDGHRERDTKDVAELLRKHGGKE